MRIKEHEKYTTDFPDIKELTCSIKYLKKELAKKKRKLNSISNQYVFVNDLIGVGSNDILLEKSVASFFRSIGFTNVRWVGNKKENEDVIIEYDNSVFLIEVKGLCSHMPAISDCSIIRNYVDRYKNKYPYKNVFGVFIVNHDNKKPINKRNKTPFDITRIIDAKNGNYCITTTVDLLFALILIKTNELSKEQFEEILKKPNWAKFDNRTWKNLKKYLSVQIQ